MDELMKGQPEEVSRVLPIPELVESFLRAQDIREVSKLAYKVGLERFTSWLNAEGIPQPDREAVLRFKKSLIESGLAANTANSYLTAVKRFFAYLEGMRKYPNVAKDVKGIQQPRIHLRESLTIGQVKDLLAQIDISSLRGKRDFAMMNLMVRTGIRTCEVIRANVEDVRKQAGETLLWIQGKGRDSKDAFVILTEKSLNPIFAYTRARGQVVAGDPLFASISDRNKGGRLTTRTIRGIVKAGLRRINIESDKLTAHSLRHSFATLTLRAGAPLIQVRDALRHSSVQTTEIYARNIERLEQGAERFIDF
jgi:integrase/recombinase XerC/integrase/recombinase XerD